MSSCQVAADVRYLTRSLTSPGHPRASAKCRDSLPSSMVEQPAVVACGVGTGLETLSRTKQNADPGLPCRSRVSVGTGKPGQDLLSILINAVSVCSLSFAELWVLMDVAESPERDPRSPEDEEEEQQGLSDDDILRESGSDQDLDRAAGRASDLEDEENAALGLSQEEEESRSDEEDQDQDSEPQELNRGPPSPPRAEEGDGGEEDPTSDLRDEASSVTRELDEHELDYDEEVPEEPAPAGQEDEAEKAGAEDDEEKGEGAPGEEGKAGVHSVEEKEPVEAAKEKKKEDDDGEIDDGEIDVSMPELQVNVDRAQDFCHQPHLGLVPGGGLFMGLT